MSPVLLSHTIVCSLYHHPDQQQHQHTTQQHSRMATATSQQQLLQLRQQQRAALTTRQSRPPRGCRLRVSAVAAPMRPPTPSKVPPSQQKQQLSVSEDTCRMFVDRDGEMIRVMCCDYGFRTGSGRLYQEAYGEVPDNVFAMAADNFGYELAALRRSFRYNEYQEMEAPPNFAARLAGSVGASVVRGLAGLDSWLEGNKLLPELKPLEVPEAVQDEDGQLNAECKEIRDKLKQLKLNDTEVWEREEQRRKEQGDVAAPWYIKAPFWLLCIMLDACFANRPIQRFWVLETVARIPYFAYISILHLYESLGFWRAGADLRRVHFAEEWNELHHLQIMESLGGDQLWFDRFLAEHSALAYYWVLIFMYLLSPKNAYAFSELVEWHATDTYTQFVETNKELLSELPPPMAAAAYYRNEDLYMFDALQTCSGPSAAPRRPPCNNLLDVFTNIRDDEIEHVKTMNACQDPAKIASDLAARRNGGA